MSCELHTLPGLWASSNSSDSKYFVQYFIEYLVGVIPEREEVYEFVEGFIEGKKKMRRQKCSEEAKFISLVHYNFPPQSTDPNIMPGSF